MSNRNLKGRTALVTGAGKRIGKAIALGLAENGADILIHYNTSPDDAEACREEVAALGVNAWTIKADFSKPDEYESLVDHAVDKASRLDILVNSASIFSTGSLEELRLEDLYRNIEVNAWVPFVLARAFRDRAGAGSIINILDTRINDLDLKHPAYILSKKMLHDLTEMMAVEFAPEITVNGVAPGLILRPEGKPPGYLGRLSNTVPLKRHGEPSDVVDAVLYLAGSRFVTGQVIYIDGGRHIREYKNG